MGAFKAIRIDKTESGTSAACVDFDEADLMDGDVTVRVTHSTVNYKDGLAITGKSPVVRRFPMIPGIDFAGIVEASDHPDFKPGDAVVLDGWGVGKPTQEECESFCALVEARLAQWYPGRTVEAYVDDQALDSRVMTDDETIDEAELCSTIGTSVWDDWCGGERASAPSVPHVARAVLP